MIALLAKRYWMSALGSVAVTAVIAVGALSVGDATVDKLAEATVRQRADRFADFLTADPPRLQALLTGISRDPDAEARVRSVANLSGIDNFTIFDQQGDEVYRARSERYRWLLRDRPGGMTSGDRLDVSALVASSQGQVVNDVGTATPTAVTVLTADGRTIGYASVTLDMLAERFGFASTLAKATLNVLALIVGAAGVPALLYVRRRRRILEADERIDYLANHDVLTALLNRARMQAETDRVMATARATREPMAYFFLDIDGLAEINGDHGQAQGDELLRVVAARLSSSLGRNDLLGRIGADDFVFLHRRIDKPDAIADLARRVTATVCAPVDLGGVSVRPQISIGVARVPEDGRSHAELLKRAEMALHHHKAEKVGDFALYHPSMDEENSRRKQIEALVRHACETNGFELFYQPIVGGSDLDLCGFEALVRLPDGEGRYVSPAVFVPIAEARGYIKPLGTWVLQEACRQIGRWPEHLYVSVNLSTVQFRDDDLVDIVEAALGEAGIEGRRLEVEIVESLVLDRSEAVLDQLGALRKLGVTVAMDDFGTGYSSLSYLWRFGFDKLKIDQSFMKALAAGEPNVEKIVETIITMAHQMEMTVTTEGVESSEQADLLRRLGSDYLQGFRFGRPMPPAEAAGEWLVKARGNVPALPSPADRPADGESTIEAERHEPTRAARR